MIKRLDNLHVKNLEILIQPCINPYCKIFTRESVDACLVISKVWFSSCKKCGIYELKLLADVWVDLDKSIACKMP